MIDKLPVEILTAEICSKLTLMDTVQVGIALKQNSSSTIFDPERIYPKKEWLDNGYDLSFYKILTTLSDISTALCIRKYDSQLVID